MGVRGEGLAEFAGQRRLTQFLTGERVLHVPVSRDAQPDERVD